MKNGLFYENGELIYYKNDEPYHAGVIEDNGDLYYIGSNGKAVCGMHVVHREMSNGLLPHGTYTFGDDFKLVKDSYIAPVKQKSSKKKRSKHSSAKNKKLSTRNKINFTIVGCAAAIVLALCIAATYLNSLPHPSDGESTTGKVQSSVTVTLPSFEDAVLLCSPAAKSLYDGKCDIREAVRGGTPYRPLEFSYTIKGADGILVLSENPDLSNSRSYVLSSKSNKLDIHNLKTGTEYYYKVTVQSKEYTGTFKTAAATRYVNIPGVSNTRDIGGYLNSDGKMIKQGYIIRGGELDGLVVKNYFLSKEHADGVRADFGFVYDLDLRESKLVQTNYNSRLGTDVRHRFYTAPSYSQIINSNYAQSIKDIFSDLADPNNYPMYLHGTYGADRTGTIVYLLQGILNMSEEEMMTEYMRTSFVNDSYASNGHIEAVISNLEQYKGESINEKIEDFLISTIGVTKEEIESIRRIMIKD